MPKVNIVTGNFAIVALRADNEPGFIVRTFPSYPDALSYLAHNLPKRKNLDMVDPMGSFVNWDLTPTTLDPVA